MAHQRAVIFANGEIASPQDILPLIRPDDLLIAADAGAVHALAAGFTPHVLIGDLDSIAPEMLAHLEKDGTQIHRYPTHKNETDLELAVRYALQQGSEKVLLLAALGNRWDMTLSSFFLLARWEDDPPGALSPRFTLVDGSQEIFLILPGKKYEFAGRPGETVSLIPIAGAAAGVTTYQMEYPLNAETLELGSTRGISNVMLESRAAVEIQAGKLLCFRYHPTRESTGE